MIINVINKGVLMGFLLSGALINKQKNLCNKLVLNFAYAIWLHGKCGTKLNPVSH